MDKKQYNYMENVLQKINSNYISLSEAETKKNNAILQQFVELMITKMKEKDELFKAMYFRIFYGGSYYDGLKVGKPEEFDLDLLLNLPAFAEPKLTISNKPGFVHVKLEAYEKFMKQPEAKTSYAALGKLIEEKNHYLDTVKVKCWMESVVQKALNSFTKVGDGFEIKLAVGVFKAKISKGGPAFTVKLSPINNSNTLMDIDLVPCFELKSNQWPPSNYRPNSIPTKSTFFIVPKQIKDTSVDNITGRYWRLSFQEQERVMINGIGTLKPTIKLLKRLRDQLNHAPIASYYIKTVFLWEVEKDKTVWNNSLSFVLMHMLKKYTEYLEKKSIPYYWNKNHNLIGAMRESTLTDYCNRLKNIISEVERNKTDPYVLAKYLVDPAVCECLRDEVIIGKKYLKQQSLPTAELLVANTITASISSTNDSESFDCVDCAVDVKSLKSVTLANSTLHEATVLNDHNSLQMLNKFQDTLSSMCQSITNLQLQNETLLKTQNVILQKLDALEDQIKTVQENNDDIRLDINRMLKIL